MDTSMRPIYKKLLIIAVVLYVIGICLIQVDMYISLGRIEHMLIHADKGYGLTAPCGKTF